MFAALAAARSMSSPAPPFRTLAARLPVIVSPPEPPMKFSMFWSTSELAAFDPDPLTTIVAALRVTLRFAA